MFGSAKIQNLEAQVRALNEQLQQEQKEKLSLKQQLEAAQQQVAALESQLADTDLEQLKEDVRSTQAEYEGLKDLYAQKIQDFESSKEDQEQAFAREAALKRHNLENEIRDNRQANQDYVSSTVKTFSESYNYYLNQIKLLMDALGDVAARTGEALFAEDNDDLKSKIGQQMADKLKAETDPLRNDTGDLILIGSLEEAEPRPDEEIPAEETPIADLPEETPAEEPAAEEIAAEGNASEQE